MSRRDEIISRIVAERARQYDLPGIEFDTRNHPNDWLAVIGKYCFEEVRRGSDKPTRANFEDSLVKSAAIIVAALEHCDRMEQDNGFSG